MSIRFIDQLLKLPYDEFLDIYPTSVQKKIKSKRKEKKINKLIIQIQLILNTNLNGLFALITKNHSKRPKTIQELKEFIKSINEEFDFYWIENDRPFAYWLLGRHCNNSLRDNRKDQSPKIDKLKLREQPSSYYNFYIWGISNGKISLHECSY